jgi:chaperonin GroES
MKAYGKRVLIKPDPIEETSAGGIVLPKTAQEAQKTQTGTIVSVGEEVETFLRAGEVVLLFKNAGVAVSFQGTEHLLVSPENILAIL